METDYEILVKKAIKTERGFFYFVNGNGDICRQKRRRIPFRDRSKDLERIRKFREIKRELYKYLGARKEIEKEYNEQGL